MSGSEFWYQRPTDPADPTTWKPGGVFYRVVERPTGGFAAELFKCEVAATAGSPPLGRWPRVA